MVFSLVIRTLQNNLDSSTDFEISPFPFRTLGERSKHANDSWYQSHLLLFHYLRVFQTIVIWWVSLVFERLQISSRLSILDHLSNTVGWMVSILLILIPPVSFLSFWRLFQAHQIQLISTLFSYSTYLFSSLARSKYLFIFWLSYFYSLLRWNGKTQ